MKLERVRSYWCHQCSQEVRPNLSQCICPLCSGDFIEEIEDSSPILPQTTNTQQNQQNVHQTNQTNQQPQRQPVGGFPFSFPPMNMNTSQYVNPMTGVMQQISQLLEQQVQQLNNLAPPNMIFQASFGSHPNLFQGLFAEPELVGNPGDYLFGSGMEQFLNHLFETTRYHGPPAASKEVVKNLKTVKIESDKVGESTDCAVCKEEFLVNEEALELLCHHLFHKDCIMPWLEMRNSCPVCRFELPTDDPDYEQMRQQRRQQQNRTTSTTTSTTSTTTSSSPASSSISTNPPSSSSSDSSPSNSHPL